MEQTDIGDQKTLRAILKGLEVVRTRGSLDLPVRGIAYHSGSVEKGFVFVAVPGKTQDGHRFVQDALQRGAVAAVVERIDETLPPAFTQVLVPNGRRALAVLGANFYGHPASALTLVGITGTNGKTTTAHILEAILAAAGLRVGLLGTIEYRYGDQRLPAPNTTPESLDLQRILRAMVDAGVTHGVMEVTSHALDQSRVLGCFFRGAVFTNLTRDHLDYHGTMETYLATKMRLFEEYLLPEAEGGWAVLNAEDPASGEIQSRCRARVIRYGYDTRADFHATRWAGGLDGTDMTIRYPGGEVEVSTPLLGQPNVLNALAACACAWALGVAPERWEEGLRAMGQVPGRFEPVISARTAGVRGASLLVDYAHTPDALDRALSSARGLTRGRLICVFGCGGERDQGKRPLMAQAAARHCDLVVVTSDNPRGESPSAIIEQVVRGFEGMEIRRVSLGEGQYVDRHPVYAVIEDRREAIREAIGCASSGDLVVVAGKGHETYQILGSMRIPFDDREVARQALEEAGE